MQTTFKNKIRKIAKNMVNKTNIVKISSIVLKKIVYYC